MLLFPKAERGEGERIVTKKSSEPIVQADSRPMPATPRRGRSPKAPGWLSTRARTDLARVTVYSLHALQKRTQAIVRHHRSGQPLSESAVEALRAAMLGLWDDAHRYTPKDVPLSYEEAQKMKSPSRPKASATDIPRR